jgi:hypothetical protein
VLLHHSLSQWTVGSQERWCKGLSVDKANIIDVVYNVLDGQRSKLDVRRALEAYHWDYDRATYELTLVRLCHVAM